MINPESISREAFNTDISSIRPPDRIAQFLRLPSALTSFAKFLVDYNDLKKKLNCTPYERGYLESGPALLTSLWSYCHVSGRNLNTLAQEEVLLPGIILYHTVIAQDDNLDYHRKKNPDVEAKTAFWERGGKFSLALIRGNFRYVIDKVNNDQLLGKKEKSYIKSRIAAAYKGYGTAEDKLAALRGSKNPDLYHTHIYRSDSYGVMAQAITAILNGNTCLQPASSEIESKMAWFELGAGLIDDELDLEEDRPRTMTPGLAAAEIDLKTNLPQGTTAERMTYFYLSQMNQSDIQTFLLFTRYLYPRVKNLLQLAKKLFPKAMYPFVVDQDK